MKNKINHFEIEEEFYKSVNKLIDSFELGLDKNEFDKSETEPRVDNPTEKEKQNNSQEAGDKAKEKPLSTEEKTEKDQKIDAETAQNDAPMAGDNNSTTPKDEK